MEIKKGAYDKAIKVLELCATPHGFHAAYPGYDAVWARDSMITSLGASRLGKKFKNTFKHSLITLAKNQSQKGQIPNAVDKFSKRKKKTDFKSIDSTLWFIIGNYIYKKNYNDSSLFNKQKTNLQKALTWLSYQDIAENSMLVQQPNSDWQDAFPHNYGHTINTQALYYYVLTLTNNAKEAKKLKKSIDDKEDGLWDEEFFLPWRWKNHNKYQEKGNWFDSLGNLLSITFNLADKNQSEKILSHIKKNEIEKPSPIKSIYPPITKGSKYWHDYFQDCNARASYHYLNGGIWPFIGGFYILTLIKQKKFKEANFQLTKLAEANMKLKGNFSEWLDGKTGKPSADGGNQAWNAGMYILAYLSLEKKKILLP
ncbi:MAG: glycoside hydrolase 100 family protein [archaeon]